MRLSFSSNKLEKLCTDEREMKRKRSDIASRLQLRINALRTAASLTDLAMLDPSGKWHELLGDRRGQWSGRLSPNWRIIVEPTGDAEEVGATVLVVELEDYH